MKAVFLLLPAILALAPLLWPARRIQSGAADTAPTRWAIAAYLGAFLPANVVGFFIGGNFGGAYAAVIAERLGLDGRWFIFLGIILGISIVTVLLCATAYFTAFMVARGIPILARRTKR